MFGVDMFEKPASKGMQQEMYYGLLPFLRLGQLRMVVYANITKTLSKILESVLIDRKGLASRTDLQTIFLKFEFVLFRIKMDDFGLSSIGGRACSFFFQKR